MPIPPQLVVAPHGGDDELRLPRPPGVIRQFWARHPLLGDTLVALIAFALSLPASVQSGSTTWSPLLQPWVPTLVVIASCALLVLRRRWPEVVLAAAICTSVSYLLAASPMGSPVMLVACYTLAVYRSARACWTGFGIAAAALTAVAAIATGAGTLPAMSAVNAVLAQLVIAFVGVLVGINVGNRRRYVEAIIDRSRQLLVERDRQARLATEAERRRIAREMHDIVSHSLTVIVALTEGAAVTDDRDRARAAAAQAAQTARSALREMRAMLGVLRDENGDVPFSPVDDDAVPVAVERARQAGFPVTLTLSGTARAPRAVRFALGRIVQEGLTNAMRHAPHTTSIDVSIAYLPDAIAVQVRDDGAGRAPAEGGYGLMGLRERVARVGGTIDSGPSSPGSWRLRAHLPFPTESGTQAVPDAHRATQEESGS